MMSVSETVSKLVTEDEVEQCHEHSHTDVKNIGTDYNYKFKIYWPVTIAAIFIHIFALWGLYVVLAGGITWKTAIWTIVYAQVAFEGITMGAHRLFTHKSFKAAPALKMFLLLAQVVNGQRTMFMWVRIHRQHHRHTDTDADPHNSLRGFFYSHIGWLLYNPHPLVPVYGRKIDMSDLTSDWMIMWQKKYYPYLFLLLGVAVPMWVPVQLFGESWLNAFLVCVALRFLYCVHFTFLVNSAAHLYGMKPYDKNLTAVESKFVSMLVHGEGWHNYHHAFPWDYKTAETFNFNVTATLIKLCEKLGLAWDLKTTSSEMVQRRALRSGDGSYFTCSS